MPGFENMTGKVREKIESVGSKPDKENTLVDVVVPSFGERLSGEPFLRLGKDHIGGHDVVIITSGPGTYKMLGQLNLLLRYLVGRRAERIAVVSGYLPLARSDKDEGVLEFALPPLIIDQMMNAAEGRLDRIIAADLHSPQVVMAGGTGLVTEVSMVRRLLHRTIEDARNHNGKTCLALPDDGAAKRIEGAFKDVEARLQCILPIVFGAKRRRSSGESALKQLFGDLDCLPDSTVILLDDELASGGTNINTAELLKRDYGAAEVWTAVTHGIFCGDAVKRLMHDSCPVDRIYVTDTIPTDNRSQLGPLIRSGKLVVVSWCEDLAWIIYHHHWDLSIREMR
ncbi:hypothetical protein KKF59_02470 [Patescibacteria group bacterium]|nr:hypothetical protein [Patescibacteria group bacterium]MBU1034180.1 hypothetical protein [Patescibacteria group bacterium]MBU1629591.1 hypothetical protein [Patescibacteria group bacterium]MBU1907974.1 hypothetical protein [Patescibacteria group bacterium]